MSVYNTEKYLSESINSVLSQTFSDWELICVDDGSTDNSLNILKEYSEKDHRISYKHIQNSGISVARNVALDISIGKYVIVLDSDDLFAFNHIELLFSRAVETGADCVIPVMKKLVYNENISQWESLLLHSYNLDIVLSGQEAFALTFPWFVHACNLWNGNMIRSLRYATFNCHNSDEYSSRVFFLHSNKIVFGQGTYYYRLNSQSVTKKMSLKIFWVMDTNEKLEELARKHSVNECVVKKMQLISFNEIISKQALLIKKGGLLTKDERSVAQLMIRNAYRNFYERVSDIQLCGLKGYVKKKMFFKGYFLFYFSCKILNRFISC